MPAMNDFRAFAFRVLDVRLDLPDGAVVDQRAVRDALLVPAADLERLDLLGEQPREGVVDAFLHVDAVRADARLARGAELAGDSAGDGGVEVGVVEDDEWGVAAQLEGEFFQSVGGLLHEELADGRGAGEGDFAHGLAGREG